MHSTDKENCFIQVFPPVPLPPASHPSIYAFHKTPPHHLLCAQASIITKGNQAFVFVRVGTGWSRVGVEVQQQTYCFFFGALWICPGPS